VSDRAIVRVSISNRLGLHARPAMSFVDAAGAFQSCVRVRRADSEDAVDGKSIMQLLMLAATRGTELEISAEGPDAEDATRRLRELVESGFGEE